MLYMGVGEFVTTPPSVFPNLHMQEDHCCRLAGMRQLK